MAALAALVDVGHPLRRHGGEVTWSGRYPARARADHAASGDARACRTATTLASELYDCYTGRRRSFLNPYRTSFGPGSFVVRGQGRRPPGAARKKRRR